MSERSEDTAATATAVAAESGRWRIPEREAIFFREEEEHKADHYLAVTRNGPTPVS